MTAAEMNRRIAEISPKVVARIEKLARQSDYTPRDIHTFRIPGSKSLAHINAIFRKMEAE